jgi:hypothetical protein
MDIKLDMKLVLIVLGIVFVVLIASYAKKYSENFTTTNSPEIQDINQNDVPIKPLIYDRHTGLATSASQFIGLPDEIIPPWGSTIGKNENDNLLMGLDNNMCSKSCCSQQYPPPFAMETDELVCKNKDKFVSSNYTCNNAWQDVGCVCMTDNQRNFLAHRGGNS